MQALVSDTRAPSSTSAAPAAKRSALACLPCRTAKNKCDGAPPPLIAELSSHLETKMLAPGEQDVLLESERACTRCARLDLECIWQPSHRTGRPRKRARGDRPSSPHLNGNSMNRVPEVHVASAMYNGEPNPNGMAAAQQAYSFDATAAMMMDLIDQKQGDEVTASSGSLSLSEADLLSLLNSSPFDSSRAAIEPDADHSYQEDQHHQVDPSSQHFDPSLNQDHQLMQWFDQFAPPTNTAGLDASQHFQSSNVPPASAASTPLLPNAQLSRTNSNARNQLSALRARLKPVSQVAKTPDPTTAALDSPSSLDFGENNELLQRYINRNMANANVDDAADAAVLGNGYRLYFCGFAKAVPLLGEAAEFENTVVNALPPQSSARRLLARVVATLGYVVSAANLITDEQRNRILERLRAESRVLLSTCLRRIQPHQTVQMNDVEALAVLQAMLLLAYDGYGQNQHADAGGHMRDAAHLALCMRLNLVDSPASYNNGYQLHKPPLAHAHTEALRRMWWELYLCDLMFNVTTGGSQPRYLDAASIEVAVHTPLDPGFAHSEGGKAGREAYDVRIRTCALIHECTKPPANPDEPDLERVSALDTTLSNMMIVAQRCWAEANVSGNNARCEGAGMEVERVMWANDTRVEVLYTAMTMLHACRIHLHRLAWFCDLTMDFSSCSFKRFDSNGQQQVRAVAADSGSSAAKMDMETRQMMLSTSVSRIVSSADAIMRLMRLDQRMAHTADPQSYSFRSLPAHWPFLGCCNMVAAYGYVVAVAASGPEESNLPTYGDEIRLFDQNPTTPASMDVAGRGEVRRGKEAMVWKLRAAISNIGFAESTLAQYSQIWPVCGMYRNEVALCRGAIDQSGPTGMQ